MKRHEDYAPIDVDARDLLPPTHPDGQHKMRDPFPVDAIGEWPVEYAVVAPTRAPKPPPAGLDPVKWATLSRKERRELLRYHARLMKKVPRA